MHPTNLKMPPCPPTQVAFNNVFVQLPMTHFFYRAHVFLHGPDTEESIRTLPSVGTVMWQARCIQNAQP